MRRAVLWLVALSLSGLAQAQTADLRAQAESGSAVAQENGQLKRARQIDELIAGKLSPEVDADQLFLTDLSGVNAPVVKAVRAMVEQDALFTQASRDPTALAPLDPGAATLAVAQARFLRLPEGRRDKLLSDHAARVRLHQASLAQKSRDEAAPEQLRAQIAQLKAFLAGQPTARDALVINMADDRMLFASQPSSAPPAAGELAQLQAELVQLQMQVLDLPDERRLALQMSSGIDSAAVAITSTDVVARNRQAEAARVITSEKARLFGVSAAQARFAAQLDRAEANTRQIEATALSWSRQVREVATGSGFTAQDADALYQRMVASLQAVRAQLGKALRKQEATPDPALTPRPLDPAITDGMVAAPDLVKLRTVLLRNANKLAARQQAAHARDLKALRDAMVRINGSRLELIPYLSEGKRSAVLGFGSEGIAQVRRELSQISLDFLYQIKNWRQKVDEVLIPFRHPTPSFVMSILLVILMTVGFRWWRIHGSALVVMGKEAAGKRRPLTIASAAQATLLRYVERVGAPFDWLVYVLVLRWMLPDSVKPAGLPIFWLIVIFLLAAWLAVRLVNELARGRRQDDPRAQLRFKSISLVVGTIVVMSIVLALTLESVGAGAIYNWTVKLCWLLAIPVLITLARWWRERIVSLAAATGANSSLLRWVAQDPGGIPGLLGRLVAGAMLLFNGARSVVSRRIRDLALVQELFEQRERAQAARQVAEDKASGRYRRISREKMEILAPHRATAEIVKFAGPPNPATEEALTGGTIALLTGERGLGKSATMREWVRQHLTPEQTFIYINAASRGFDALLAELARQLGISGQDQLDEGKVLRAIAEAGETAPVVVTVDDLQRMIVPAIGGLEHLDRLISFARGCGASAVWLMSMGTPAWTYVSRARFDRALFDRTIMLERWSPEQLRALIDQRTVEAGLEPDFGDLTELGSYRFDGELTPTERKQAAYFDRLFEYANGNPAITLEFWRRSLFLDSETGQCVVRTFATPDLQSVAGLPDASRFVLRAILQMDCATQPAIELSTDLSSIVVTDALRGLERFGVIEREGDAWRITMFWWAEAVRLLQRQNLIVRF